MSEVLQKAKSAQRNCVSSTSITVRLSLFEDMIAEIERLTDLAETEGLKPVLKLAEARKNEGGKP